MRVDRARRKIEATVKEVASALAGPGASLGSWLPLRLRARAGRRFHAELWDSTRLAVPEAAREVHLSLAETVASWKLQLTGRADVLVPGEQGLPASVYEFKSRLGDEGWNEQAAKVQVILYAYMFARKSQVPVRAFLVHGEASRAHQAVVQEVHWDFGTAQRLLSSFVALVETGAVGGAPRVPSIVVFPYPRMRAIQEVMVEEVIGALRSSEPLLMEAPTGSGKTAAVLYAAMSWASEEGRRIFYLTAKTTQQKLVLETASGVAPEAVVVQIRAKAKACPLGLEDPVCSDRFCRYAEDFGARLAQSGLIAKLVSRRLLTADLISEASLEFDLCPFGVTMALVPRASLVVCDYNYVFDPAIALEVEDAAIMVDEAHNLPERAREYFSLRFGLSDVAEALVELRRYGSDELELLFGEVADLLKSVGQDLEQPFSGVVWDQRELPVERFRTLSLRMEDLLVEHEARRLESMDYGPGAAVRAWRKLDRLCRVAGSGWDSVFLGMERDASEDLCARVICVDGSPAIAKVVDRSSGFCAFSATLRPFEYSARTLGLDPELVRSVALPAPFPPENRLVMVIPDIDTRFRARGSSAQRLARLLERLAPPGRNVLVLFPSYAYLRLVRRLVRFPHHTLVVQEEGLGDRQREELLRRMAGEGPVVLMAVLGGSFAEGVDYPGEMLSMVVVVSPGLPQVCLERELLMRYVESKWGRGFEYAYLIPGMTRVLQAAGRLIRSEDDEGVVVLVGRRFLQRPYVDLLPEEWTGGEPWSLVREDPARAVREFFGSFRK